MGSPDAHSIAFEAFGVSLRVSSDRTAVLERVRPLLPPGARACAPTAVGKSFAILAEAGGTYRVTRNDSPIVVGVDLEFALMLLDSQLRISVGLSSPDRIFIHAGVVAHEDRAIVLPGLSLSGKTTLVVALIRAGATYYSDEFAVLDEPGLVHPYAKPLSIRDGQVLQSDRPAESFGAVVGEQPLRIGAVVFTRYRPGAEWSPTRLSPGRGALAMLEHTVAAIKRSDEAMRVIKRAIDGAVLLEGERGEAAAVAERLLDCVQIGGQSASAGP